MIKHRKIHIPLIWQWNQVLYTHTFDLDNDVELSMNNAYSALKSPRYIALIYPSFISFQSIKVNANVRHNLLTTVYLPVTNILQDIWKGHTEQNPYLHWYIESVVLERTTAQFPETTKLYHCRL